MDRRRLVEALATAGATVEGARAFAGLTVWGRWRDGRRFEFKTSRWWAFEHATVRVKTALPASATLRAQRAVTGTDDFARAFRMRTPASEAASRSLTPELTRALTSAEWIERFALSKGWALVEADPGLLDEAMVVDALRLLERVK